MKCQKNLFQIDDNIHYLNCAYMAPILKSAEKASISAIKKQRNPINFSPESFFKTSNEIRTEFSKIINSKAADIAIMPSTSYGFSSVFKNIKLSPSKNNAVTIENEFPSGYFSIQKWSEINQKNLIVVKRNHLTAEEWNNRIISNINKQTSVVLSSSIHWMNGTKLDLKKIGEKCKEVGAYFIVDGTQSVGATPLDVKSLHIDALICASYKWLFGPYSMALGYFSEKFNDGTPIEESWMNRSNAKEFSNLTNYENEYRPNAGRYNVGQTSNFILSPIMLEGLKQLNKWGIENIAKYCDNLFNELKESCNPNTVIFEDPKYASPHLFSLGLDKNIDTKKLKGKLEDNNIYVSLRGDSLRVSINIFNDSNDIKKLVKMLN
jgi:selenocysteine lyase/cysteine desulfurase